MPGEGLCFVAEPMCLSDVPEVLAIERVSFSSPWPPRAYRYELLRNGASHYFVLHRYGQERNSISGLFARLWRVLRRRRTGEVVGYGGFWSSGHRAHISTLAVVSHWRRRGFGLLLLLHMLQCAIGLGMRTATLEVRASNQAAQNLYHKCGFRPSGIQRGYYRDNGEDAVLMSTPRLTLPAYEAYLASLREELQERLGYRSGGGGC